MLTSPPGDRSRHRSLQCRDQHASVLCRTKQRIQGGISCPKASPLLLGSRYRCPSSPVRPPLTPINGALLTELRAGLTVGSSRSNNAALRSAETAVSASQTSSTRDPKLRPPAANESTIRANARRYCQRQPTEVEIYTPQRSASKTHRSCRHRCITRSGAKQGKFLCLLCR